MSTSRLRPLTNLPASKPTVLPVAVAAFLTLCVSIMTPVGCAFLGIFSTISYQAGIYLVKHTTLLPFTEALIYGAPRGDSPGTSRHKQPFFSTYKMALTSSKSGHLLRRRT
jgi:hypothetical protein